MRQRTSLLTGLPLLLLSTALVAQEPPPPPPTQQQQTQQQHPLVRQRLDVLMRGITLEPQQQQQVDSIVNQNSAEILRAAAGNGENGHVTDELRSALEKQEKQIRDVLTPEQQQVFDRNAEQLKEEKGMYDEQQKKDSVKS
jgi:Spy/CpxP family protein refolding chaperone